MSRVEPDIRTLADVLAKQRETLTGSVIFRYTVLVYDYLYEHSEVNEVGERLFTGSISNVINEIIPSKRYYSAIRRLLESPVEAPCIQVYQRGTGNQPSVICLMRPPPDEWAELRRGGEKVLTPPAAHGTVSLDVEQRVARLEKMVTGLKEVNLSDALLDHERRLGRLESQT